MKTQYKNLQITAKLKSEGVLFPNMKGNSRHNKFCITVKNLDLNKYIRFDFYDSNNNYTQKITTLSNDDLLNTLDCFIQDAIAGELSQEDFCNEFGYDYFDGAKIHRLCQKANEKANKIILEDIYNFANELKEFTESL